MNDLKFKMLGDLGYTGSLNDRKLSFYLANGATSKDINTAEYEWLGGLGFTGSSLRDRWQSYFRTVGLGTEISEYAISRADNLYFSPRNLFLTGEKGVWYDPSDFSTMFQDAAGTTPVTAVGQPVGKILDKSGNGAHATQSTATSRPILGQVPKGGARNLLKYSEQFDNAAWAKTSATITPNSAVAPDGTMTADVISFTDSGLSIVQQLVSASSGTFAYSVWLRVVVGTVSIRFGHSALLENKTITTSWQKFTFSNTTANPQITIRNEVAGGVKNVEVWGAQLETGSVATTYQRTTELYDVFESGQQHLNFLHFDGVDDWLSTAAIDFTGTDKMTVVAGVRKLSDAAAGIVAELSVNAAANNGAFYLAAPEATTQDGFLSRGTVATSGNLFSNPSPVTSVLTGTANISADSAALRRNGTQVASSTSDQGTGNYGNYTLYIGRRGGTSLPFNGRLYGLIVRGATSSTLFIEYAEKYLNRRTGAF